MFYKQFLYEKVLSFNFRAVVTPKKSKPHDIAPLKHEFYDLGDVLIVLYVILGKSATDLLAVSVWQTQL